MVAHYEDETVAVFACGQERSIAEQIDLGSLTRVVLTHLHFDHAGGLGTLPRGVPIYVQRAEWEAGRERAAIERNFLMPRDYEGIEEDVVLVDGDHDLLGDGSIELLSTPGHTPGHQSVRVGRDVIGADVAHYASTFDDLRLPAFVDDPAAQRRSLERLRGLRDDEGLSVRPGHDPDAIEL
jgi:glyoxylase-like metal-dependent hydrolase (beta-lactamase superfamily II)